MSSGPQACYDDEKEWIHLQQKANITSVKWKVYSNEATLAEQLFFKEKLTGIQLILRVEKEIAIDTLKRNIDKEYADVEKAITLLLSKGFKVTR